MCFEKTIEKLFPRPLVTWKSFENKQNKSYFDIVSFAKTP